MNGGTGRRPVIRHIALGVLLGCVFFALPRSADAATLFVAPAAGQFGVGQTFAITLRVNSQGQAVNAIEGVISFNPSLLQVVSVTSPGSIFNLNVQDPEYSNVAGTVRWTGVILNPGYTGGSGNLLTVTFRGVGQGTAVVNYSSAAVLANDGHGTNVLAGTSGGTYTIGPVVAQATPTPDAGSGPVIRSTTHPDPVLWYSNNDPLFQWDLPSDVDAVSYLLNPRSTAVPGNVSDGRITSAQLTDVAEGPNYFHVKFRRNGVWGAPTHFPFNVDTGQPERFTITRTDVGDPTNPRPELAFRTTDAISGVAQYVMRIGEGDWFDVPEAPADRPFRMPLQAPGTHEVTVEAVDGAGNGTRSTLTVTVVSITRPIIDQYPDQTPGGTPFMVSGRAEPGVTVRLKAFRTSGPFGRVLYSDATAETVDATADATGHWFAQVPALPDGLYRLEANSIDARGAISYTSEPVQVRIGYSFWWRIWDFLRSLLGGAAWFRALGWLALLLLLLLGLYYGWRWLRAAWLVRPRALIVVGREEKKVADKLAHLWQDMTDELVLLERVEKHRPLYPEEKYLRSKLTQYRKALRVLTSDTHSRLAKRK